LKERFVFYPKTFGPWWLWPGGLDLLGVLPVKVKLMLLLVELKGPRRGIKEGLIDEVQPGLSFLVFIND
jgi:hypothetical protein